MDMENLRIAFATAVAFQAGPHNGAVVAADEFAEAAT
jgi:hypothetical protein